jgi:hypothetical protein
VQVVGRRVGGELAEAGGRAEVVKAAEGIYNTLLKCIFISV